MTVVFDHRDPGTAEAEWERAAPWRDAPPLTVTESRVVVLAAHPDDETLGAGGLIATVVEHDGLDVEVVVATGDAMRRRECAAALDALAPRASLRFLGLPDGGLGECAETLARMLGTLLDRGDAPALVVAPWWGDGHPDHRVLGEAAVRLGRPGRRVLGYPIWLWHWGDPRSVDTDGWLRLDLSAEAAARKATAIAAYRSQLEAATNDGPMLHAGTLAHFARPAEVFVAPDVAAPATTSPDHFDARFEQQPDPWGFDTRWYERRKRDLVMAALPHEGYRRGLELGCANGALTERLAARVGELVAVDGSPAALERARQRLPHGIRFERRVLPGDWPPGVFDLVVFSEIGFYLSPSDLDLAVRRIADSLAPEGVVVACHWRMPVSDGPLRGDDVHAALRATPSLRRVVRHEEDEFLLDVFARRG